MVSFSQCNETEAVEALVEENKRYSQAAKMLVNTPTGHSSTRSEARRMSLYIDQKGYQIEIEEVE